MSALSWLALETLRQVVVVTIRRDDLLQEMGGAIRLLPKPFPPIPAQIF